MIPKSSLFSQRLVPVAVIDRVEDAVPLARALIAGGLPVIEVTLRTEAALDAMRAIRENVPEMALGAGTVLNLDQVATIAAIGVEFAVAPGLNERVVKASHDAGIPIIPGVITPTEVEAALELGLRVLKFFPAESFGGASTLKALAGPYGHTGVRFVPTGGITLEKAAAYWAQKAVAAVGGSWFVPADLVRAGDFGRITELTAEAIAAVNA